MSRDDLLGLQRPGRLEAERVLLSPGGDLRPPGGPVGERPALEAPQEPLEGEAGVAPHREVRPDAGVLQLRGVELQARDASIGREALGEAAGLAHVQPRAHGDDEVGALDGESRALVAGVAVEPEREWRGGGEGAEPQQALGDRDLAELSHRPQRVLGAGEQRALAGEQDWALASEEPVRELVEAGRVGRAGGLSRRRLQGARPRLSALHVHGQIHQHRPRAALGGDGEGHGQDLPELVGVARKELGLGDGLQECDRVHLLEPALPHRAVAAQVAGAHLAGEEHEGRGVEVGVGDHRRDVGHPGAAGDHGHLRLAGQARHGQRRVAGALLVPAHEELHLRRLERVEDGRDGPAGVDEDAPQPASDDGLRDDLGAEHGSSFERVSRGIGRRSR